MTDPPQHTVIPFACPACQMPLRAAAARAGKPALCPACGLRLVVPDALPDPPATVPAEDLEQTIRLGPPAPRPG